MVTVNLQRAIDVFKCVKDGDIEELRSLQKRGLVRGYTRYRGVRGEGTPLLECITDSAMTRRWGNSSIAGNRRWSNSGNMRRRWGDRGVLEAATILLKNGARISSIIKNYPQRTALEIAAEYGDGPLIDLLVAWGHDVEASVNVFRQSPLFYAHTVEVARHLVQNGANVSARDINGNTPMHVICAAKPSHRDDSGILYYLLTCGARVDELNYNGDTPLNLAIQRKNVNAVRFLLENGADVFRRNGGGVTPLEDASHNPDSLVIPILRTEIERIRVEMMNKIEAFVMGLHPRLGERSLVRLLDDEVVRMIRDQDL